MTPVPHATAIPGRRPRAALVWGAAVFVALQLALALAIEVWWPLLRDPFYGYKALNLRARTCTRGQKPFTVVMIGSSRTAAGLQAGILEDRLTGALGRPSIAFNFGVPGAGPVTQLLHLKRLLRERIRPDLLLIEVLPPLLDGQLATPREAQWLPASRLRLPELRLLGRLGFPATHLSRAWHQAWPLPAFSHRFAILSRLVPAWLPWQSLEDWGRGDDASGWAAPPLQVDSPEMSRRALEHARGEYMACLQSFRLGVPACQALAEILALCRKERIAPALVVMPEGPIFRSWYAPGAWEQVEALLKVLSRRYDAPLINARAWQAEADFSDSHHLRTRGALDFTRRLTRSGVLPLLHKTGAHAAARVAAPPSVAGGRKHSS